MANPMDQYFQQLGALNTTMTGIRAEDAQRLREEEARRRYDQEWAMKQAAEQRAIDTFNMQKQQQQLALDEQKTLAREKSMDRSLGEMRALPESEFGTADPAAEKRRQMSAIQPYMSETARNTFQQEEANKKVQDTMIAKYRSYLEDPNASPALKDSARQFVAAIDSGVKMDFGVIQKFQETIGKLATSDEENRVLNDIAANAKLRYKPKLDAALDKIKTMSPAKASVAIADLQKQATEWIDGGFTEEAKRLGWKGNPKAINELAKESNDAYQNVVKNQLTALGIQVEQAKAEAAKTKSGAALPAFVPNKDQSDAIKDAIAGKFAPPTNLDVDPKLYTREGKADFDAVYNLNYTKTQGNAKLMDDIHDYAYRIYTASAGTMSPSEAVNKAYSNLVEARKRANTPAGLAAADSAAPKAIPTSRRK